MTPDATPVRARPGPPGRWCGPALWLAASTGCPQLETAGGGWVDPPVPGTSGGGSTTGSTGPDAPTGGATTAAGTSTGGQAGDTGGSTVDTWVATGGGVDGSTGDPDDPAPGCADPQWQCAPNDLLPHEYGCCDEQCQWCGGEGGHCGDSSVQTMFEKCDPPDANTGCDEDCNNVARKIFVSSEDYAGNFGSGGALEVDKECDWLYDGPVDREFRAWILGDEGDVWTRFPEYANNALTRFELMDGTLVAVGFSNLYKQKLQHAITLDEGGVEVQRDGSAYAWTNIQPDGTRSEHHCANWSNADALDGLSGMVGRIDETEHWTQAEDELEHSKKFCVTEHRIYCLEVPMDGA
jgi:hypothetical protein